MKYIIMAELTTSTNTDWKELYLTGSRWRANKDKASECDSYRDCIMFLANPDYLRDLEEVVDEINDRSDASWCIDTIKVKAV